MANGRHLGDILEKGTWSDISSERMQHIEIPSTDHPNCWAPPFDELSRLDINSQKDWSSSTSENNSPEGNILPMYSSSESWSMAQDFINSGSPKLASPLQSNAHRRTGSHRIHRPKHPGEYMMDDMWDIGTVRPRVFSMPFRNSARCTDKVKSCENLDKVSRLRKFTITPKGLISQGECIVKRSVTPDSSPDTSPTQHTKVKEMRTEYSRFRVVILGSSGVGKQSLIYAFVKDRENDDNATFDEEAETSVSILLDGEESKLQFVDYSDREVDDEIKSENADAFIVVYSVEHRDSYEASINRLLEVREEIGSHVALILVANKTDLVRSRVVTEEEGRAAAKTYDSKYIEVSATIDHKIDELLVGVLKQIRLFKQKFSRLGDRHHSTFLGSCCLLTTGDNVLAKIFKRGRLASKSCDNLYVL